MKKIIFLILIIAIGGSIIYQKSKPETNDQITITATVVEHPDKKFCENYNKFKRGLEWEAEELGKFSNGKKLLLSKESIKCIGGQVSPTYMLLDITDLNLEVLMHESVHMGQHEGKDQEVQAYGTTQYYFEAIEMLSDHDPQLVKELYANEMHRIFQHEEKRKAENMLIEALKKHIH